MKLTIEDILKSPELPSLPVVTVKVLALLEDPDVRVSELESLILVDPGLAARVLKTVNSARYGLRHPCTSIHRAVSLLGLDAIRNLVLSCGLAEVALSLQDVPEEPLCRFWRRLVYSAVAAREMAMLTDACDPEEAFLCGMFQDVGLIALLRVAPDEYPDIIGAVGADHRDLTPSEWETLGLDHARVGAALCAKWGLPERVCQCIEVHHIPDQAEGDARTLARCVYLGQTVELFLSAEGAPDLLDRFLAQMRAWFGHEHQNLLQWFEQVASESADIADVLDQPIGPTPHVPSIVAEATERQLAHQISVQRETEALRSRNTELAALARTDPLTGAGNRAHLEAQLESDLASCRRENRPLALLFLDADRFKAINDAYGHTAGDLVIQELADRVREAAAGAGEVCRFGGEEFALVLPGWSSEQAHRLGERIRAHVASSPVSTTSSDMTPVSVHITVSVGIAVASPDERSDVAGMLREADQAVYAAKREGRDCVCARDCSSGGAGFLRGDGAPAAPIRGAVLIVDADPFAARHLAGAISGRTGRHVEIASDLLAVHRAFAAERSYDVIVFDPITPGGAAAVLAAVRRADPNRKCRIVVVATVLDRETEYVCRVGGASSISTKAVTAVDLDGWIAEVFGLNAPPRAGRAA